MNLSRVLLVVLLTVGSANALKCYTCKTEVCKSAESRLCEPGQMCMIKDVTERRRNLSNGTRTFIRACTPDCSKYSVNLGFISTDINCCSFDYCNHAIDQAISSLQCHGCLQQGSDFQCRLPGSVRCQSTQDKCATIDASLASGLGRTVTLRACVSASFCFPERVYDLIGVRGNISCCDHNLCNGSEPTAALATLHLILLLLFLLLLDLISL